ncbi:MAG: hypothetical protein EOP49_33810 [Sphingobacteriales bacterium]|nr:MAG: hypothetical protein EOP49_33810 [Sphingobacteriales bacterium]
MTRILSSEEVMAFLDMMNAKTSARDCWRQIAKKELELDLMKFSFSLAQLELRAIDDMLGWPEGFYEPELESILQQQQAGLRVKLDSCNVAAQEKLESSIHALYKKLKRVGKKAEQLSQEYDCMMAGEGSLDQELESLLEEGLRLEQGIDRLLEDDDWGDDLLDD